MPHEHETFYRLIPAWVVNEIRDRLACIERNQEKIIMADTTALTAAVAALTTAVKDLADRVAASQADQPAIDAAAQGVTDAVAALNAIDPAAPPV